MINPYRMKGESEEQHAMRVLNEENAALRKELRELRFKQAHRLPEPADFIGATLVLPLRFGEVRMLEDASQHDVSCYRMFFSKEYSDHGMFWRAEPFATDPRSHRKSRR